MNRRDWGHVPSYRVLPEIAEQIAAELEDFETARGDLRDRVAEREAKAAEFDALSSDATTTPEKLAEKRTKLIEEIGVLDERGRIAQRQTARKRTVLNNASELALRSPESIRRRRETVENFREEDVAEVEAMFGDFRAKICEKLAERKFVGLSIAAELRTVEGGRRSGNFDASGRPISVPNEVDYALSTALGALTQFPYRSSVRKSIIGEGGYDRLAEWEWSAADFPVEIRDEIASGLEARVARGWIRGEFNRWKQRNTPTPRTTSKTPETVRCPEGT